jgi:TfoX/Sxy family transcriptional regulator of competence genes
MAREALVDRVRAALARVPRVVERRIFGGITFMVNGKMCISVGPARLMCRINPEQHDIAVARKGARTVRMNGRAYRGFIHVRQDAVSSKRALDYWVRLCLAFNKRARATKTRRRLTGA